MSWTIAPIGRGSDLLYSQAGMPSLDLRFAESKTLVDYISNQNLITFTRASIGGTYVDSQGVIRNATTNLLLRSEEFDNASWAKARCSITQNAIAAPNGSITADLLIEDTSLNTHRLLATAATVTANSTVTFSVYFKSKERAQIQLYVDEATGAGGAAFSAFFSSSGVSNGLASGGATYTSGSVQALGDGWYRAVITGTLAGGYTSYRCSILPAVSGAISYQGDGTSGIYLWGAQLEQSSTVGEYIPTTSTINSAPRFDHNPSTGESLGLLVEEARTNSISNNTMVGAVAGTPGTLPTNWAYFAATTGLTASIVGTGTESGIAYIDLRLNGTAGSALPSELGFNSAAAATGQTWTFGAYWRIASGSTSGISSFELGQVELTAGAAFVAGAFVGQTAPTSGGLVTQRPAYTRTLSGGGTVALVAPRVRITPVNGAAIDITLRIGMPQLEQGAFATSVIPTTGTAATRAADVASITGTNFSSWYRQDEGTVFAQVIKASEIGSSRFPRLWSISDGTLNNTINATRYSAGTFRPAVAVGGVGQAAFDTSPAVAPGSPGKFVYAVKQDDIAGANNGGTVVTDTSATLPTVNQMHIGDIYTPLTTTNNNGAIARLTYWPQRLSNEVLQNLTV